MNKLVICLCLAFMASVAISCSMAPLIVIPDEIDINIYVEPIEVEPITVEPLVVEENQSDILLPPLWRD